MNEDDSDIEYEIESDEESGLKPEDFHSKDPILLDNIRWAEYCTNLEQEKTLTSLNLTSMRVGTLSGKRLTQFCSALAKNQSIKELILQEAWIGRFKLHNFDDFANAINANGRIQKLDLSRNWLDGLSHSEPDLWVKLYKFIETNKSIQCLDLSHGDVCQLLGSKWKVFCEAIQNNSVLTDLNLSWNSFGHLSSRQWGQFWQVVSKHTSLRSINLEHNALRLGGKWAEVMLQAIEDNTQIECLNFGQGLHPEYSKVLTNCFQRNIRLKNEQRHLQALTFAHCLQQFQLRENGLSLRNIPSGVTKHILSFFESKKLIDQVLVELKKHDENIKQRKQENATAPKECCVIS